MWTIFSLANRHNFKEAIQNVWRATIFGQATKSLVSWQAQPILRRVILFREHYPEKPLWGGNNKVCMYQSSFKWLACVAWRFCWAGRRSGVAAKFAREARENERRSREKNKNRRVFQVASAPISSRFLCPRPTLLLSAPNQNRHATQAIKWRFLLYEKFHVSHMRTRLQKRKISDNNIFNFFCKHQALFFVVVRTGPK